ncbi:MAG: DUF1830 domain-containing protein [Elainellaceae cyanobacterium]
MSSNNAIQSCEHSNHQSSQTLCYYFNPSRYLQIIRMTNIPQFQRVVFPQERLLFEASPQTEIEVQTCSIAGIYTSERIPCDRLMCS